MRMEHADGGHQARQKDTTDQISIISAEPSIHMTNQRSSHLFYNPPMETMTSIHESVEANMAVDKAGNAGPENGNAKRPSIYETPSWMDETSALEYSKLIESMVATKEATLGNHDMFQFKAGHEFWALLCNAMNHIQVQRVTLSLHVDNLSDNDSQTNIDTCHAGIRNARAVLRKVPSVRYMTLTDLPMSLMTCVLTPACANLHGLEVNLTSNAATNQELVNLMDCIFKHSSLTELALDGIRARQMTVLIPGMLNMRGRLTKLRICGPVDLTMPIDANVASLLGALLHMKALTQLHLDHVNFVAADAVHIFGKAISTSAIQQLNIGSHVLFPENTHSYLAKTLANSPLVELDFDALVGLDFLIALRKTLVASATTRLERLSFYGASKRLDFYASEWSEVSRSVRRRRLHASWLVPVERTLRLNRQRRTSAPLFDVITKTDHIATKQLRMVTALVAVDAPIVYENLCRNQDNLQALLLWHASGEENGGQYASPPH
ncbi:hypothetical protein MPSEU_000263400 [Mayamaea pseudoterrestris]|nr:hypothetical protein MPSEU_000263400 [Mayamaea pseudoterrestris]